jgi:hypothetical protein
VSTEVDEVISALNVLTSRWKFEDLANDPKRRHLLQWYDTKTMSGESNPEILTLGKKLNYRSVKPVSKIAGDPDWRIWFNTPTHMLQWRTGRGKEGWDNHRLVITTFGKKSIVDRLPLRKLFKDPSDPKEGEVMLLLMMYPELTGEMNNFIIATKLIETQAEYRFHQKLKERRT